MSERPLELPIVRVTVYEDRAEVVREATITLNGGGDAVVLRGLSPLLSETRVAASLEADDAREVHVDDLTVEHHWIDVDDVDAKKRKYFEKLEKQLWDARDVLNAATDAATAARDQEKAITRLMERYADEVGKVVARGEGASYAPLDSPQGDVTKLWTEGFSAFEEKLDASGRAVAEAFAEEQKASREVEKFDGLLTEAMKERERYVADLHLRLSGDAGKALLRVASTVPCALWRPSHEAHLRSDPTTASTVVEWTVFANVWQKTGEDWDGVDLELSTARPSAGAELPRLAPDLLRLREKTPEERKKVVVEHRHEALPREDLSGAAPGVYDGGEPRRLAPEGKVTLPSDGRPHRVAVTSFDSAASMDRVAMPELSKHVFLRARLRNRAGGPLLAGPVVLLDDGAHAGIGDLSYVGADEDFDVSFGSDDRFAVDLKRRRKVEKKRIGKDRVIFVADAELSRIGGGDDAKEEIQVLMRLPKSEVGQLEVVPQEEHCDPWPPEEDEHGVVRVPLTLAPGERGRVKLGFSFETSGDVEVPDPW